MYKRLIVAALCLTMHAVYAQAPVEGIYQMTYTVESTSPTPIYQATAGDSFTPGYYALSENITTGIVIDASNVNLDLNGYTVTNATGSGITVNSGFNNIKIYNGTIGDDTTGVQNDCINLDNNDNVWIQDCVLTDGNRGLFALTNTRLTVLDCTAVNHSLLGFRLNRCENCLVKKCQAKNIGTLGFALWDGANVIIDGCIAENILREADDSTEAYGFSIVNSASNCVIKNCVASNIEATAMDAPAYGIWTDDTLNTPFEPAFTVDDTARSIDWHPTGNWVAVAEGNDVQVYTFDGSSFTALTSASHGAQVNSVAWSPDGASLAIAGALSPPTPTVNLRVFAFNGISLGTQDNKNVLGLSLTANEVAWHPSGKYIAAVIDGTGLANQLAIYEFLGTGLGLSQIFVASHGADLATVQWHPSGQYVAVGGVVSGGFTVRSYLFEPSSALTPLGTVSSLVDDVNSISWCADGNLLAVGTGNVSGLLQVYTFNGLAFTLFDQSSEYSKPINSVQWHPTSHYILIGGQAETASPYTGSTVFAFKDGALARLSAYDQSFGGTTVVFSVSWSKQAEAIAYCGNDLANGRVSAYTNKPINCIITNNIVSDVQTPGGNGYGIDGLPMWHMITGNQCYSNDRNYAADMTDIYSAGYNSAPGLLQNISL